MRWPRQSWDRVEVHAGGGALEGALKSIRLLPIAQTVMSAQCSHGTCRDLRPAEHDVQTGHDQLELCVRHFAGPVAQNGPIDGEDLGHVGNRVAR